MTSLSQSGSQTPAQWAVRWFALVAIGVLLVAAPLWHIVWHWGLGRDDPLFRTRSQVPAPAPTVANVVDGSWMAAKERELREASPLTWWLRGSYNELRWRLGVPQSRLVHFGRDGWLFMMRTIEPDYREFERSTPGRQQLWHELREIVQQSGAELVVVIVPDKARVYADKAYPDGVMPAAKTAFYARVQAELAQAGVVSVDLAAALQAARAGAVPGLPPGELYFRRDTHWRPPGALAAGMAIAAAIEQRLGDRLPPRQRAVVSGQTHVRASGDLTTMLGLCSVVQPDPVIGERPLALSLLTDELAEERDYYAVSVGDGDAGTADAEAPVLLLGTSFAEENGARALALALGRPVRQVVARGAGGLGPLRDVLPELRAGTRAKVVVWEIIERGLLEPGWRDPRL